jgi:opacity protein-like surface antigen
MRIRRTFLAILAAFVQLVPATSQADDFDRFGPYVGLNAVYAIDLFEDQISGLFNAPPGAVDVGSSPGLNARVGLRAFSWIAIEAQYEWVQDMEVKLLGIPAANFREHVVTGNIKLFLPFWRIQPYILGGAGASYVGIEPTPAIVALQGIFGTLLVARSDWGFAGRLGAGLDMYLTKHIALNVEGTGVLTTTSFNTSDLTATPSTLDKLYYFSVSAGLVYRF